MDWLRRFLELLLIPVLRLYRRLYWKESSGLIWEGGKTLLPYDGQESSDNGVGEVSIFEDSRTPEMEDNDQAAKSP